MPETWGDIYWKWRRKGADHGDCAYRADEWEKNMSVVERLRQFNVGNVSCLSKDAADLIEKLQKEVIDLNAQLAVEKEITANLTWAVENANKELEHARRLHNAQFNLGPAETDAGASVAR